MRYTECALQTPRTVRCTALAVALLVGLVPLLPQEHVHLAGIEGRAHAVAHSHWLEESQSAGSMPSFAASHGDHGRAIFLTTVSDRVARLLSLPIALAASTFFSVPALSPSGKPHVEPAHQIHAPPGHPWLTRGPPSLS